MNKDVQKTLVLISQLGISMIVPIALCMALGIFIADKTSMPIITVPFFILGALAGFRNVYILVKDINQDGKKKGQDDVKKHE